MSFIIVPHSPAAKEGDQQYPQATGQGKATGPMEIDRNSTGKDNEKSQEL